MKAKSALSIDEVVNFIYNIPGSKFRIDESHYETIYNAYFKEITVRLIENTRLGSPGVYSIKLESNGKVIFEEKDDEKLTRAVLYKIERHGQQHLESIHSLHLGDYCLERILEALE